MLIWAAVWLIAYWAVSGSSAAISFSIAHISRPLRNALGALSALFPLSVMELMYVGVGLWLMMHIVRSALILLRLRRLRPLLKAIFYRAALLLAVIALLLVGYLWLWGMDYNGVSFSSRSGIETHPVNAQELHAVAQQFLLSANRLSRRMPREEDGSFALGAKEIIDGYGDAYENIEEIFPLLSGVSRRPKAMIASRLMSWMGFTGVYFPFTGESNINTDSPASLTALTVAHELAHQRGVYAENECNFIGVLACTSCDNEVYQYAGYFGGLIYLMNELYDLDKDAWQDLRGSFTPQLEQDWTENNAYWRGFEGAAEEIAGEIYDGYLKANGQELGILSYDACVELLVAYFGQQTN